MNREEVIRMAREAGIENLTLSRWTAHTGDLERFAALVAAAEREACAKYMDDCGEHEHANYIRSRGEVKP